MTYEEFLATKAHPDEQFGFEPIHVTGKAFEFQRHLIDWSIRKGRSAVLADCGLGKSLCELAWADNVLRKTNKPVLLLTPIAVGAQMVREGEKFGIECVQVRDGKLRKGINVTNYEQLTKFSPSDFRGVVCDESAVIKHSDSKTRKLVTAFLSKVKYRLLASATPAPNDYMELGTSSEALGVMQREQMLGMFFTNGGEDTQQWMLKGHAKKRFWKWVCTWARACRKPSDLGFPDDGFVLPEMAVNKHVVTSGTRLDGFGLIPKKTLDEQRAERRATIKERCEKVAELVPKNDYCLIYCHLNPEGDLLERLIPGAVQVAGCNSDREKEERLTAFANGEIKVLVTKPKLGGWGLNLQVCNHIITFPSWSYESFYQLIRRCWRFGQKRKVTVDLVTTQAEMGVLNGMQRKERQMVEMFAGLVEAMSEYQTGVKVQQPKQKLILPSWLSNGVHPNGSV